MRAPSSRSRSRRCLWSGGAAWLEQGVRSPRRCSRCSPCSYRRFWVRRGELLWGYKPQARPGYGWLAGNKAQEQGHHVEQGHRGARSLSRAGSSWSRVTMWSTVTLEQGHCAEQGHPVGQGHPVEQGHHADLSLHVEQGHCVDPSDHGAGPVCMSEPGSRAEQSPALWKSLSQQRAQLTALFLPPVGPAAPADGRRSQPDPRAGVSVPHTPRPLRAP